MKSHPVRYLVLWLTTACNLRCRYCYRRSEAPAAMTRDVAKKAISLAAVSGLPFHVQLAGGEPTLEPELIEFVGRMVRKARWPATLAIQTNGTLIDRTLINLFRRYDIAVGVSLDGPPDVQEELRGDSGKTFRGLALLEQEAVPFRVTAVLSSLNAGRLHDLVLTLARFFTVRGVGLDPVVRAGRGRDSAKLCPSAEAVRLGIRAMHDAIEWIKNHYGVYLEWREMEKVRHALSGNGTAAPYCHACNGESLAVHPDGAAYPCGQTIGDPDMAAGAVDSVDWTVLENCYQNMRLQGNCKVCPLAGRCPGDCPSRLHYNSGDGPVMCTVYQTIAEKLMEKQIRRNIR